MQKIKKYFNNLDTEKLGSRLLSYSALTASVLAFSPDMHAQCVPAGGSLPVDIDGDGTPDVTISDNQNPVNFVTGTSSMYFLYQGAMVPGPVSMSTNAPNVAFYSPLYVGPVDSCTVMALSSFSFNPRFTFGVYVNYISLNTVTTITGFINTAALTAGANQIVGLSAGSSVCTGITAAGTTAAAPVAIGSTYSLNTVQMITGMQSTFQYFYLYSASDSVNVSNPNGCISTFGASYTMFTFQTFTVMNSISTVIPINLATNTSMSGSGNIPFIGVEFPSTIDGGTHFGWVQLSYQGGQICVDATGWNACSVEEVAAAGAAAGTECIAAGTAGDAQGADNNANCTPAPACDADVGTFPGRD